MHIGSEPLGFLNETPQLVSKVLRHLFPLGMELQQPTSHVPSCSWRHTATRCWTYPGSLFSLPCRSRAEAPRPINKALPLSPTIRGPKPILRCQAHMDCHAQPEPSHSTRGPERRLLPGPREAEAAPSLGAATLTPHTAAALLAGSVCFTGPGRSSTSHLSSWLAMCQHQGAGGGVLIAAGLECQG